MEAVFQMKILLTGGAGFIGSNVADGYISAGHDVAIVDNLFTGSVKNLNAGARFYLMDVRARELAKVFEMERPDVVNHHAAQMSVPASVADPAFDADVNIMGLINLLECCVRYGVKKVIFISSGGAVYGETGSQAASEQTVPRPLSPYAITKFTSENYLNFYRLQYGLVHTVLRYANIYGPRQVPHGEAGVVSIFMSKLIAGQLPVIYHYPDAPDGMVRDYCCVGDIVRANVAALDGADDEVVNIGTSVGTSTGELYRTVLGALRRGGMAMDGKFDSPGKGPARPGDLRNSRLDVSKAVEALGWIPRITLAQGIDETLKHVLTQERRG
jgi:UDP-glucose 4-epimerase